MASRRVEKPALDVPERAPAATPDEQEAYMGNLAVKLAEKQLKDGTASSQVQVHYLKLVSSREQREQQKLEAELALLRKKVAEIDTANEVKGLLEGAMQAMRSYQGLETEPTFDD